MLERDPKSRISAHEVLCELSITLSLEFYLLLSQTALYPCHSFLNSYMDYFLSLGNPWIVDDRVAPDKPLDSAVLSRLKQFSAMHKLKKMALRVCFVYIFTAFNTQIDLYSLDHLAIVSDHQIIDLYFYLFFIETKMSLSKSKDKILKTTRIPASYNERIYIDKQKPTPHSFHKSLPFLILSIKEFQDWGITQELPILLIIQIHNFVALLQFKNRLSYHFFCA